MISVQISTPEIPGLSSESVFIDFASGTVEFAAAANDNLSRDSEDSSSGDLLPRPDAFCLDQNLLNENESGDKHQLSPSLEGFNAVRRKFWDGSGGGEAY